MQRRLFFDKYNCIIEFSFLKLLRPIHIFLIVVLSDFTKSILSSSQMLNSRLPYSPPDWALSLDPIPKSFVKLSRLPTPIHTWSPLEGIDMYIKRDDMTSFDISGNKVRKLEFLLEDALLKGHDSVITIGGIQSNHARATAVASRQLGLDPYLILRTPEKTLQIGYVGNLLLDRLVGAQIRTVTPSVYAQIGQLSLINQLADQLREEGRNPYCIPVGGSNGLGTWGYLEMVRELAIQMAELQLPFDHIVFACGSGGTACGIALGIRLAGLATKVHAMAVCDSPAYFYAHMESSAREMGADLSVYGPATEWCMVHPAQGIGYARSTEEELRYITQVSQCTGVILDPVYTGKALYYFSQLIKADKELIKPGERVLFLHTGGVFGMYDKVEQLGPIMGDEHVQKMDIQPP